MPSITVEVDRGQLEALKQRLAGIPKRIPRVLAGAVNDTAKKEIVEISKAIRQTVAIKKADVDKFLHRTTAAPGANPTSTLTIEKSRRLPLKYFGAKQVSKGVSYRIDKGRSTLSRGGKLVRGARQLIPGGFGPEIPRLGGHVFVRVGKARLPIRKLFGPSAWGVFTENGMDKGVVIDATALLLKNLSRRVNLELLRQSGAVK